MSFESFRRASIVTPGIVCSVDCVGLREFESLSKSKGAITTVADLHSLRLASIDSLSVVYTLVHR